MKKYRVAFIGTGGRSTAYANAYAKHQDEIDVVALCDVSADNRQIMAKMTGLPKTFAEYGDYRQVLDKHPDLDGVVISTPNYLHREMAIPFIERGITVALEKPMTTTMADGEAVLENAKRYNSRLLIGFVLRSTPFYSKVNSLISGGAIGRVVAIEADELAGYGETSTISRRPWRRYSKFSGGALMEKSCHDLDLMSWFIGSRPTSVNSFGGSLVFNPNPLLPEKCADCSQAQCAYRSIPTSPGMFPPDDLECIYNVQKDVVDNQCVNISYANGAIVSFIMCFNTTGEKAGRNLHVMGQKGRIWGNHGENEIFVFDNLKKETTRYETKVDESGHGGGDTSHALELLKMMKEPGYRPAQDAYAGYLAGALCIASDISRIEGRRINLRYGANDHITFVN
jgi:predicted dehydrogenase